jgi:mono/diheme cytochrome c family protein
MVRYPIVLVALAVSIFLGPVAASADQQPANLAEIEKGMKVYAAQKCAVCHSIAGSGNPKFPLDGVGAKLTADEIRLWITHPVDAAAKAKSTAKPAMRAYPNLPKADLDALVAYMQSLDKKDKK